MSKVMHCVLSEGFRIGRDELAISHLQSADDTICFIKAEEEQVRNWKHILKIFESILGLKVNLSKSSMVGIGLEDESLKEYAKKFGCKVHK